MLDIKKAEKIFKKNFIGPEQLNRIARQMNIVDPSSSGAIPLIKLDEKKARKLAKDFILILGMPQNAQGKKLTINAMRSFFGSDPSVKEPCFYNQDWYLKEKFASETTLKFKWYLIRKNVQKQTRGKNPQEILNSLSQKEKFPSAILTAFTFFAYWFCNRGETLWKNDFIWCSDKDKNNDRIYTGRYQDPNRVNKNGFNVHRHLSIRLCYGAVVQMEIN